MNMNKWEYKTNNNSRALGEIGLNELGKEGWELVSHTALASSHSLGHYYIFKRLIKQCAPIQDSGPR